MSLVLSLFPGIGLLDMAFEAEGFAVVAGPDVCWGRDIRDFHPPAGRFDGIIGGPPCQPFSPLVHLVRANGREPKHGNLIPEYERVVAEAQPTWFVMEEVPQAPLPVVADYAVHSFILDNCWLGEAQMRRRRFSFGVRGETAIDLRRWIQMATFELPDAVGTLVSVGVDNSREANGLAEKPEGWTRDHSGVKQRTVRGKNDGNLQPWEIARLTKQQAVTCDPRAVPVAIGGSGKAEARAVVARELSGGISEEKLAWQKANEKSGLAPGNHRARSWEERCALQGLPPDFLAEAPFTAAGKFSLLGNGVPLPMGRAIAKAVKQAVAP